MIYRITFGYNATMTPEQFSVARNIIGQDIEAEVQEDGSLKIKGWREYDADVHALLAAGIYKFEIKETLTRPVLVLLDRLEKALSQTVQFGQQTINTRCEVHVPGLGLLALNDVQVVENYCTEALQERLNEGWRIVAVCPQPDQRRPDYVLGRHNNDK